jgi:hypothetical protein
MQTADKFKVGSQHLRIVILSQNNAAKSSGKSGEQSMPITCCYRQKTKVQAIFGNKML